MQAAQILASRPSQLFHGTATEIKSQFRKLIPLWHPDHCKDTQAEKVFQHILKCRDAALRGEEGLQRVVFTRTAPTGTQKAKFALDYIHSTATEIGTVYVSYSALSYLINPTYTHLAEHVTNHRWSYPDAKVEKEIARCLPVVARVEHTTDGLLLVYGRTSDQILLSDLITWHKQQGTAIDPRHVMWIISSLLNLCCYLEIQHTAHCALLPQYLMCSLDMHTVAMAGPPMYATPFGLRPKTVPSKVLKLFPRLGTPGTVVKDSQLDLLLVRSLVKQLLGVTNAALFSRDTNYHQGLRTWLCSSPPASALKDYKAWEDLRGKRAFLNYGTTASEAYVQLAAAT